MFLEIINRRSFCSLAVVLIRFGGLLSKVDTQPVLSDSVTCNNFPSGFVMISFSFSEGTSPSVTKPEAKQRKDLNKLSDKLW